jgi:hypothetical protein
VTASAVAEALADMARADGGVGAVGQEICAIWGRSHVVTKLLAQCVYDVTPWVGFLHARRSPAWRNGGGLLVTSRELARVA